MLKHKQQTDSEQTGRARFQSEVRGVYVGKRMKALLEGSSALKFLCHGEVERAAYFAASAILLGQRKVRAKYLFAAQIDEQL